MFLGQALVSGFFFECSSRQAIQAQLGLILAHQHARNNLFTCWSSWYSIRILYVEFIYSGAWNPRRFLVMIKSNIGDGTTNQTLKNPTYESYFFERENGKFSPRSVLMDLDCSFIKSVPKYFDPSSVVGGKHISGSLYAHAYHSRENEVATDHIRKQAEKCSGLMLFMMNRNLGGGTGSGMGAKIHEHLYVEYGKKTKYDCSILPWFGQMDTSIVEIYNTVLALNEAIDNIDATILFDNEAMYENSLLYQQSATWDDINYLYGQTMSHLTTASRFEGPLSVDIMELTCMIPYPRIQFYFPSLAPFNSQDVSVTGLINSLFDPANCFVKLHSRQGLYARICMMFRGDVQAREVTTTLADIKQKRIATFVDWAPTGFKCGLHGQPAIWKGPHQGCVRSAVMLSHTTATGHLFQKILVLFDRLYSKKSFVHWYVGEGMEEAEFSEARENIRSLIQDFEEIGMPSSIEYDDTDA